MDIPRKSAKRMKMIRRGLIATTGLIVVAAVTVGVSRLEPAAPGVDRRTLWLDKVKRGPMLREVRGVGTLVSEDILWVPAVVKGRVIRSWSSPAARRAQYRPSGAAQSRAGAGAVQRQDGMEVDGGQAGRAESAVAGQSAPEESGPRRDAGQLRSGQAVEEVDEKEFENDLISLQQITLSRASVEQTKNLLEINRQCLEMYRTGDHAGATGRDGGDRAQGQVALRAQGKAGGVAARAGRYGRRPGPDPEQDRAGPIRLRQHDRGQDHQSQEAQGPIEGPRGPGPGRDASAWWRRWIRTMGRSLGKVSRIDPTVMDGNVTVDVSLRRRLPQGARPDLSVVGTITIEKLDDVLNVGRPVFASSEGPSELFKVVEDGRYAMRSRVQFGRTLRQHHRSPGGPRGGQTRSS